jgi:hypothetical protein
MAPRHVHPLCGDCGETIYSARDIARCSAGIIFFPSFETYMKFAPIGYDSELMRLTDPPVVQRYDIHTITTS